MIEIIFLFIILPRRVRALAKDRGESTLKWSLMVIGAWIGAEILMGVILGVALFFLARVGIRFPQGAATILMIIYYLLLIAAAATAATLVIRALRRRPLLTIPSLTAE